jgi:hypothetical protein
MSFVVLLILAAIGAGVWTALDKRTAYPRLATATWIGLRFMLSMILFSYGFAKLFGGQFGAPDAVGLDRRVGEMSPMGMLWTFQGSSTPYTYFAGFSEIVPAMLLMWRRTATIGALIAMGVMTNVVVLNFCYDVPVKLYSSQLLLMAAIIAMPQARRFALAALGYAVPEVPPRVRSSARIERLRVAAKLAYVALVAWGLYQMIEQVAEYRRKPSELAGIWRVEHATEVCKLEVGTWAVGIRHCNDERELMRGEVIPAAQVIVLKGKAETLWRYQRDGDRLVIDGLYHDKPIHLTLKREPAPLLVSRGFHWIQEFPFNR